MIDITIDNIYTKIDNLNKEIENLIWATLSYEIQTYGMQYPVIKHLYNRKTHKTYTGLLPYILDILNEHEDEYNIIDNRIQPQVNADFNLVHTINDEPLTLRPYQQKIINECEAREVIQAATGAGKTLIMAGIIAKFNVSPVIIFANTNSLCQQLRTEISKFLGRKVGLVCMGVKEIEDITVYSIQSATENDVINANMILFDECHHIAADTFVQVAKWCQNAYYRIGVSATPWRDDNADLMIESSLSKRNNTNNINASYLIREGYLVPCNIYMLHISSIYKGKNYHDLYLNAIVNNHRRNYYGCKCALKMLKNHNATTLILIKYIEHGEIILSMLQKALCKLGYLNNTGTKDNPVYVGKMIKVTNPINNKQQSVMVRCIEFLSGKDDPLRRTAVIEGVKKGIVKILIGSTIADEGLDIPNLDCLILLGGGKSSTKAFQRIGRVIRNYTDENGNKKTKATIFDFDDATPMLHRHALQRMKMYKTEEEWTLKAFNMDLLK